jgi:secreted trypsin-like serine protease
VYEYSGTFSIPGGELVQASDSSLCGGTLIDRKTVLTAAHCIPKKISFGYNGVMYSADVKPNAQYPTYGSMFKVHLGLHNTSALNTPPSVAMNVKSVYMHEQYNPVDTSNDIALLFLEMNVTLSNNIQIACLPTAPSETYPGTNVSVYAAGWGALSSGGDSPDVLQNVKLTAYPASSCSKVAPLTSGQICAGLYSGGKDTCQGDSGGPLYFLDMVNSMSKYVVAGVVSFGKGCGSESYPGVYTRVSAYLDWIQKIKNMFDSGITAEPAEPIEEPESENIIIQFLMALAECIKSIFEPLFQLFN